MVSKINNFVWLIGGEAGYGILTAGEIFSRVCMAAGLSVFTNSEYPSLIRGGHNTFMVRADEQDVNAHANKIDILVALNKETIDRHVAELKDGAAIIFDPETITPSGTAAKLFPVPFSKILAELGAERIVQNSIALGASVALLGLDFSFLEEAINKVFGTKSSVIGQNISAAQAGYSHIKSSASKFGIQIKPLKAPERLLMTGNDALALGAVAAGCKFAAIYPMTPTSQILHRMAGWQKACGIIVIQPEDEICGINAAVGASYTGVRSLVATSGGGFSLMVEALGMAGMIEASPVIILGQRPGPSTGLPTHTSQADLQFVLHAGQGEFPRIVLTPGDVTECFNAAQEAFNLAERWQLPVIVLVDKHVCEGFKSVAPFGAPLKIDRGLLASDAELKKLAAAKQEFPRYKLTENGVSPRSMPGQEGGIFRADSDEHDEFGYLNEEPRACAAMQEKRLRKLHGIAVELSEPKLYGPAKADITIIGWGSVKGPVLDALPILQSKGITSNFLHVYYMLPFPAGALTHTLDRAKRAVCIEQNATGQFASLTREHTGKSVDSLLKYDGRQWTPEQVAEAVEKFAKSVR